MGLFGRFKAKFTKDSTVKNAKNDDVVCLGYRVHSEFDNPPPYTERTSGPSEQQLTSNNISSPHSTTTVNRHSVDTSPSKSSTINIDSITVPKVPTRSRAPPIRRNKATDSNSKIVSELEHVLVHDIVRNQGNITDSVVTTTVEISTNESSTSVNKPSDETYTINTEDTERELSRPEHVVKAEPPKSILKVKSNPRYDDVSLSFTSTKINTDSDINITVEDEEIYLDNGFNRDLAKHLSISTVSGNTIDTISYTTASKQDILEYNMSKVETVKNTKVSSTFTKDEKSEISKQRSKSNGRSDFGIGNTSKRAASIFFGEEEEEETTTQTTALTSFQQDDDRRFSVEC